MPKLIRLLLIALLIGLAAFGGFAWMVVHPTIGEVASPSPSDKAAGAPLWSFGFVGDTHQGLQSGAVDELFAKLAQAKVELVLHLGDMVDQAESEAQWQSFVDLSRRHRLRLLPTVGNHDAVAAYSDHGEIRLRRHFPWLPSTFYHCRHRDLNFLVLNSERSLLPGSVQRKFIRRELFDHPGTTVVTIHRPVFTASPRDWGNKYWRQLWLHSALSGSDANLVLSGHNHYYERTRPLDNITYVTSGGGAPNTYDPPAPNQHTAIVAGDKLHYGIVAVHADRLHTRVYDLAGDLLDAFDTPRRPPHHPVGHQDNPGSLELPPIADLPYFSGDEVAIDQAIGGEATDGSPPNVLLPADQLPRPW